MKKIMLILMAMVLISPITIKAQSGSNGTASDELKVKTYKINSLTGIKAGSVFEITLTKKGNDNKVTVCAPQKTLEHILVSEKNGVLILKLKNGYGVSNNSRWFFKQSKTLKGPIKVEVELSELQELELSGSAVVKTTDNFSQKECKIEISGASKVSLNKLKADKLTIEASGASVLSATTINSSYLSIDASGASKLDATISSSYLSIDASGAATLTISGNSDKLSTDLSGASKLNIEGNFTNTSLDCSGASHFNGKQCQIKELRLDLSGASKAIADVKKSIHGEVSGAASFSYSGNPDKVIIEKSRGASVSRR